MKRLSSITHLQMNTVFLCLLLLIGAPPLQGQSTPEIDSLLQVLQASEKEDTNKVNLLVELGGEYNANNQYEEAKKYRSDAIALSTKLHYTAGLIQGYYGLCKVYRAMGEDSTALKYCAQAVEFATEADDRRKLCDVHSTMALIYDYGDNYPEALKHYLASLNFAEEVNYKFGIGAANQNLGCIYTYWQDYEKSLEYFQAALAVWKDIDNKYWMAATYQDIAGSYSNLCDADESEKYTMMGMALAKEINQDDLLAFGLMQLGVIHWMRDEYQQAIDWYLQSLEAWRKIGDHKEIARMLLYIGDGYSELERFPDAIEYYNEGLALASEMESKKDVSDAYQDLSDAYAATGSYHQALETFKQHIRINDEIMGESKMEQLASIREQYESEKKDNEIQLLKKEKIIQTLNLNKQRRTKKYMMIGLGLLAALTIFGYWNYHTRQKLKLMTLRDRIASDLHDDLGSTLSGIAIFSQISQTQYKDAKPALEKIAESSRNMLDAMTDIVWTINPENDQFEKVIMRMRSFVFELFGTKKIDYEFIVDESITGIKLSMEARKNLYLIFKEAINNLVKYAQADKAMISIKRNKEKLNMVIRDNGIGFSTDTEFQGNGLKNMVKRAKEIGARFLINSIQGEGTTIQLEVAV